MITAKELREIIDAEWDSLRQKLAYIEAGCIQMASMGCAWYKWPIEDSVVDRVRAALELKGFDFSFEENTLVIGW